MQNCRIEHLKVQPDFEQLKPFWNSNRGFVGFKSSTLIIRPPMNMKWKLDLLKVLKLIFSHEECGQGAQH